VRTALGVIGSALSVIVFWKLVLSPLRWPDIGLVASYFTQSMSDTDTYRALLMTGIRALCGFTVGFVLAVVLAVLTGRTILGWIFLFFGLLLLQKIPAIAMVSVFVSSKLGIGFGMTVALSATVVTTFSWMVLHHRARTLSEREVFGLRLVGFSPLEAGLFGLLPHFGSTLGGTARLGMAIALIMVVLGEWQGVWSGDTLWAQGLGIRISRNYESIHSEARVLASCLWLGLLGIIMDAGVQGALLGVRRTAGVDLRR